MHTEKLHLQPYIPAATALKGCVTALLPAQLLSGRLSAALPEPPAPAQTLPAVHLAQSAQSGQLTRTPPPLPAWLVTPVLQGQLGHGCESIVDLDVSMHVKHNEAPDEQHSGYAG
jgi:hypothetical protein